MKLHELYEILDNEQMERERRIERVVERQMDHLDRKLLNGTLSQKLYDIKVWELNKWAKHAYGLTS